jgi:hypothetical protein
MPDTLNGTDSMADKNNQTDAEYCDSVYVFTSITFAIH